MLGNAFRALVCVCACVCMWACFLKQIRVCYDVYIMLRSVFFSVHVQLKYHALISNCKRITKHQREQYIMYKRNLKCAA